MGKRAIALDGVPTAPTLPGSEQSRQDEVAELKAKLRELQMKQWEETQHHLPQPKPSGFYYTGPMHLELVNLAPWSAAQVLDSNDYSWDTDGAMASTFTTTTPTAQPSYFVTATHTDVWAADKGYDWFKLSRPVLMSSVVGDPYPVCQGYVKCGGMFEPLGVEG
jgi:hypothetical protein